MDPVERLTCGSGHAAVAEVAYRSTDGTVGMDVIVPLAWQGAPAVALPYAQGGLAARLAAAPHAALVLSDSRLARKGWEPLAAHVRFELVEDPEGKRFLGDGLLGQELIKHPPSRALADTPLLRREHWWYVPRLLLRAVDVGEVRPVGRRTVSDGVLAHAQEGSRGEALSAKGSLEVDTVAVDDWDGDTVSVRSLSGAPLAGHGAPAALLAHDFSVPDRERGTQLLVSGTLADARLRVLERSGSLELGKPHGLLRRLRGLRDLERACRAGLRARGEQA